MKRALSLLMLAARSCLWKVLLLSALTAAGQVLCFRLYLAGQNVPETWTDIQSLVADARLPLLFAAGLVLLCVALALFGMEGSSSRLGYTLRRLTLDERHITLLFALHHFLCLLVFWGFQAGAALLVYREYLNWLPPGTDGGQSALLAFYHSPFLHALLPLEDWPVWVRNLLLFAALALSAAACSYHWRHGRKSFAVLPFAALFGAAFPVEAGAFVLPGPNAPTRADFPGLYNWYVYDGMAAWFILLLILTDLGATLYYLMRRADDDA